MKSIQDKPHPGRAFRILGGLAGLFLATMLPERLALAHAFGARYDLPLPLDLYLAGAGGAVVLSFVVMAVVFRGRLRPASGAPKPLSSIRPLAWLCHSRTVATVRLISFGLFCLVLAAGFFGNPETTRNIAPAFVWIIWWVGLAYIVALLGNVWPILNPWANAFAWAEAAVHRTGLFPKGRALCLGLSYPRWLGVWPAVLLFALFAWFELISETGRTPQTLACAILAYSALTWSGMALFGSKSWLAGGEAFTLAFSVFGRFAPIGSEPPFGMSAKENEPVFRPYGNALVAREPCSLSLTAFVVLMLATVSFDGFKETPAWGALLQWLVTAPVLSPMIRAVHDLGFDLNRVLETIVFCLAPVLFLLFYLFVCRIAGMIAGSPRSAVEIAGLFVFSLVPIAIAYHLAHYLSYLLLAGQYIIPLASDPFGFGWNLLGTAGYTPDITVIGPKTVWYTAVGAIVAGHVYAVGIAHFTALEVFRGIKPALRSQYPVLALMVGYTVASLWILSQPIVGGPSLAKMHASEDEVTLVPFEFRELCYSLKSGDRLGYTFKAAKSIAFDIHYHDGLVIHRPVRLPQARAADSTFTAPQSRSYCLLWFNRGLAAVPLSYRVSGP